ncbi:polysaccharide biosynthesis protein [Nostocoides jenkinsii]|uniref:Predicted nucleoside-diphosphate sugar epimerase n=1 Tax=Nostocoides jenkinsii Ben 74 TaxID=1193518 RepID=A0A077M483_9MICO|nr:nucleoside-diphosphate sugar epimerase/dehydratase [Tetrasphaera jenkinsii]CCI52026.1 Predicted nucleoside-diphosphate sugar epimerase [Tetrasphaera jenkinsii Ben 74]
MPATPPDALARWRWPALDVLIWIVAVALAVLLRFDFRLEHVSEGLPLFVGLVVVLHLVTGFTVGPYAIGHVMGSLEEVVDLLRIIALTVVPAFAINWFTSPLWAPRSVPLIGGLIAILAMFGARFVVRLRTTRPGAREDAERVIVFGAGRGGRQLIRSLITDPASQMAPVAVLDDDPAKRRWSIDGIRVRGGRGDLASVAHLSGATMLAVAVAVPSASGELLNELREAAAALDLDLRVLPPTRDLLGSVRHTDLRSLDLADLLGRGEVALDADAISGTISGKTVLVTGAGGSIGSELCRQVARFDPRRLVMLDRDESGLHATQLTLAGHGLLDGDDTVLADIRDAARMHEVMNDIRPDVVFHAAALKHLPLLESYPEEAWKTNVLGTLNVLKAARAAGVEVFVNISTDKAANPSSVLGYSKRLTERLTAHEATQGGGRYVSVRFGNVLGSRGSVITAFTQQIEQGGPVTVTHPDVERYFMLIPEACQLVLQSAAIGDDGRVMVLDMGEPMKILDVARTLISLSGRRDIEITDTGLRAGEKLTEELFAPGEAAESAGHPLVRCVDVPPLPDSEVGTRRFASAKESEAFMRSAALVPMENAR